MWGYGGGGGVGRSSAAVTCLVGRCGGGGGGGGADLKLQQLWEKMDTSSIKGPQYHIVKEAWYLRKSRHCRGGFLKKQ